MATGLLVIIVLTIIAVVVAKKRGAGNEARPSERRGTESKGDAKFHAVSLRMDANACTAARNMAGRRFLSSAAPRMPLPECDSADCNCHFVHHTDRRAGDDRRSPFASQFGGVIASNPDQDKRRNSERREDPPDSFEL